MGAGAARLLHCHLKRLRLVPTSGEAGKGVFSAEEVENPDRDLQFQNRASGVVNAARDRDIRSLRGRITLQGNQLRICGAWGRESQKSRKLSELGH